MAGRLDEIQKAPGVVGRNPFVTRGLGPSLPGPQAGRMPSVGRAPKAGAGLPRGGGLGRLAQALASLPGGAPASRGHSKQLFLP